MAGVKILEIIDKLALEKGEKRAGVYHLTLTTGDLMEPLDIKPSIIHHHHVKTLVSTYYKTISEPVDQTGKNGFKLYIKIWSR